MNLETLKLKNHPLTPLLYWVIKRKSLSWGATRWLMKLNYRLNQTKFDALTAELAALNKDKSKNRESLEL